MPELVHYISDTLGCGWAFSQHFNPDGSMYFTGGGIKVEFVTKERRDGTRSPRLIKELALTPKEKDIKQAVFIGQYALTEKPETVRLLALWDGLPKEWKALIRKPLVSALDLMPLERGVIERLLGLLR